MMGLNGTEAEVIFNDAHVGAVALTDGRALQGKRVVGDVTAVFDEVDLAWSEHLPRAIRPRVRRPPLLDDLVLEDGRRLENVHLGPPYTDALGSVVAARTPFPLNHELL